MAKHQPLFNQQQGLAQLNISVRNAVAQIQTDVVNGGSGYYNNMNVPNWPVGIVINNNVVTSAQDCHSGTTYGANCFDSFTVIVSDPNTTPVNPLADVSTSLPVVAGACTMIPNPTTDTSKDHDIYVLPPSSGGFQVYDQVLLVKSDGSAYTTVRLTAVANVTVGGVTYVKLSHSSLTAANGTNVLADDPTNMSINSSDQTTSTFCGTDYVVRLLPIQYCVDTTTDSTNPTLRRQVLVNDAATPACSSGVALANEIIGFKVGAALVNGTTDQPTYNFDSSTFKINSGAAGYDYTMVRSIMVSLVGRTAPATDPTYVFRNSFDGGPYQIQGVSVVVNPRNMSM